MDSATFLGRGNALPTMAAPFLPKNALGSRAFDLEGEKSLTFFEEGEAKDGGHSLSMTRQAYSTDLTDGQYQKIAVYLPQPKSGGKTACPREYS
jgi:hypothetical protein